MERNNDQQHLHGLNKSGWNSDSDNNNYGINTNANTNANANANANLNSNISNIHSNNSNLHGHSNMSLDNDRNATSSNYIQDSNATAMRSNIQNPNFSHREVEVAGPTMGGTPYPYDSSNIDVAKGNLADSLDRTHISSAGANTGRSLNNSFASGASNVAATAATAGAAVATAAKKLTSHEDSNKDNYASPHPHQLASVPSASDATKSTTSTYSNPSNLYTHSNSMNTNISAASVPTASATTANTTYSTPSTLASAKIEPLHSTGLNQTTTTTQQTPHEPESMKGRRVSSAAVMGATSAAFPAPPMTDTVTSTTDIPPTAPGQAAPKIHHISHETPAIMKPEYKDHENIAEEHKEHHAGLGDKIKNVFRRRSSVTEIDHHLETGNFQAASTHATGPVPAKITTATTTTTPTKGTNILNTAAAKTAAAVGAVGAAATGAVHAVNKNVHDLTHKDAGPESPHLTSSGAPKADLHATVGKPAVKVDVRPTSTLNQGWNSHDAEAMNAASTTFSTPAAATAEKPATTTTVFSSRLSNISSSKPLTEKVTAPVVGAASAVGAAAVGTAAYIGNKPSAARDNLSGTPSSISSGATMDSTAATYTPSVGENGNPAIYSTRTTSTSVPAVSSTTSGNLLDKTVVTEYAPGAAPHATSSRPLEKITKPFVGAAAAIGRRASNAAEAVRGSMSHPHTDAGKAATRDFVRRTSTTPKVAAINTTSTLSTNPSTSPTYQTPQVNTTSTTYTTPSISTASARPTTDKITVPVVGAATGTAAYLGNKASAGTDAVKDSNLNCTTYHTPQTNTTYQTPQAYGTTSTPYTTPSVNTASTKPMTENIAVPIVGAAAAGTAAYMGSRASATKDTVTSSIPSTASYQTTSNQYPSTGPVNVLGNKTTATRATTGHEIASADRIAAAIPSAYQGPIPTTGPGEEIVWVKTVTTTDIYDDDTTTGTKGHADVIETHREPLNPSSYGSAKNNETVYSNNRQQGNLSQSREHM
ncbi:hypothetical protein BGZ83_012041 [Gryganskiella cystojenkinii]|nr:hypothetical protein BGZ83_012041 [Gryganskiella cystojenkinii]